MNASTAGVLISASRPIKRAMPIHEAKEYIFRELGEVALEAHGAGARWLEETDRIVLELANNGAAILYYTTDMEELLRLCHRVAVFHDGFVVRLLAREQLSDTALVSAAFGREEAASR